jgi:hypothetical protein
VCHCSRNDAYELVALLRGIVKEQHVIGASGSDGKVLEAAVIATPNVFFRNTMAAGEDPLRYAGEVDFDAICPDVDKDDLEASAPRIRHHLEIILS